MQVDMHLMVYFKHGQLRDIQDDRWMFIKIKSQKDDFWTPDGDRTRNFVMIDETLEPFSYRDSIGKPRCKFDIYIAYVIRQPRYVSNDVELYILRHFQGPTCVKYTIKHYYY